MWEFEQPYLFDKFKIFHLSISQIKSFQRNPYYWYLSYVLKLPQEESEPLRYGKHMHALIEGALKDQEITGKKEELQLALLSAWELDKSCPNWKNQPHGIEHLFYYIQACTPWPDLKGIIDFWTFDIEKKLVHIIDHKTVGNPVYALSPEQLKEDLQMNLYAYQMMCELEAFQCIIQHNQIFKKTGNVLTSSIKIHREECIERIHEIEEICWSIEKYIKIIDNYGIESKEAHKYRDCGTCQWKYGGCPYKDICRKKIDIDTYLIKFEEKQMQVCNLKVANLCEMIKKAKGFHEGKNPDMNKFDFRELLAKSICDGIKKHDIQAVTLPFCLVNGTDPDYTPIITKLREENIRIFVEAV